MSSMCAELRARIRGLYAVTPEGLTAAALLARCAQAVTHGARVLQLRDKTADAGERRARARALASLCRAHDVLFIVNDDVALARLVDADGVHLGRSDSDLAAARAALPGRLIGASCYGDSARAHAAAAAGADYLAFGSVFASSVKPRAMPAPLALFAPARAHGLPLVAIGGITRANCAAVRAAGADACAVITDLFGDAYTPAEEVGRRAQEFRALFEAPVTQGT